MLLIFDLDDTLIDTFGCSQPIKLKLALQKMIAAGLSVQSFDQELKRLLHINSQASSGREALTIFLEPYKVDDHLFTIGVETYYGGEQFDFPISPLPGTLEVLEKLHGDKHILILVTYGIEAEQRTKMQKAKINPALFTKIIFTDDYDKSEEYRQVLQEFSCEPRNILVCGDKFKTDLLPAKELGMKTVHVCWGRGKINPPARGDVDYSILTLHQLEEIVKENASSHFSGRSGETSPALDK